MLKYVLLALSAAAAFSAPAFATGLSASQTVERIVKTEAPDGTISVTLEPATEVIPGEELVYSINFTNDSNADADNIVLTMPVPAEVSYIENSATSTGTSVAFSVDGGQSFAPRGDLKVSVAGEERDALSEEITHIRWALTEAVGAGQSGKLVYRAVLK